MTPVFAELIPESGVDAQVTPVWMMVPLESHNLILLKHGTGLTLKPKKGTSGEVDVAEIKSATSPDVRRITKLFQKIAVPNAGRAAKVWKQLAKANITVTIDAALFLAHASQARLFAVFGRRQGLATIVAEDRHGNSKVDLDVSVKKERTYSIAFNLVSHTLKGGRRPVRHTSQTEDSAQGWLGTVNYIFSRQVNVRFSEHVTHSVTVESDLGPKVTKEEFEKYLIPRRDPSFNFNVFLVGDIAAAGTDSAFYMPEYASAIVRDSGGPRDAKHDPAGAPALSIAHEAGHFMHRAWASGHPDGASDTLMGGSSDGIRIPKGHVDSLNPYSG